MRSFRRKHHGSERIMAHLYEADGMLSAGRTIAGVCRKPAISEQTDHRWLNSFWGGVKADAMKCLKKVGAWGVWRGSVWGGWELCWRPAGRALARAGLHGVTTGRVRRGSVVLHKRA